MKRHGTAILAAITLLLAAPSALAAEAPQLINYQGVLRDAADKPLSGSYGMVFHFYDRDGGASCSDPSEVLLLTDRHEGAGSVAVTGGIFNVELGGGTSEAGEVDSMNDLFRGRGEVWMEAVVEGESLCPRTRVLASAYAIGAARESAANIDSDLDDVPDTTIYVNGSTGDDASDGLTPQTAKATIRAAVRAMPTVLNSNVFIRVAAGTYEEEGVFLSRRIRSGPYLVSLVGPDGPTPTVTLTPPQPVDPEGFGTGIYITDDFVELANLKIEGFPYDGVSSLGGGSIYVNDCVFEDNGDALWAGGGTEVDVINVDFIDNNVGLELDNGRATLQNVFFSGNGISIDSLRASLVRFFNTTCTLDTPIQADMFTKVEGFGICSAPFGQGPCSNLPVSSCCVPDGISVCQSGF